MNRKKIVAGNWKMNTTLPEAIQLVKDVMRDENKLPNVQKIFFPPFVFLIPVADMVSEKAGFYTGAQNINDHEKGAYTGEVSASMLRSARCSYVLVGHSERRAYFNETDEQLISKIRLALDNKLQVIFCFGEKLEERKAQTHFKIVEQQLSDVLKQFSDVQMQQVTLAYEPVWAIGTGETATPQQAQEMHAFVRETVAKLFSEALASQISILYGGSCNPQNAPELFACPDVDGGLIGGASLNANDFCKIINSFS